MCTIILKNQKPIEATEDITVYKSLVYKKEIGYSSIYEGFSYKKDVLYETKFTYTSNLRASDEIEAKYRDSLNENLLLAVEHGFHSLKNLERRRLRYNVICIFIIPKGTMYYENPCGNIVSNKIILKGSLKMKP